MLRLLKSFFKPKEAPTTEAPYKVETPPAIVPEAVPVATPAPAKCGCGRSPTGNCVGLHKLTPEEWAVHADNPVKPSAKKKPAAKKPAAMKAPAKPKAPRKPKAK